MKVLHTESSVNWGGQEYRILEQMQWLEDHGHNAVLAARPASDIAARARNLGLSVREVSYQGHYNPKAIIEVRRIVRRDEIDIADCHGSRDAVTQGFARNLCPIIRSRHLSQAIKAKLHRRLQWRLGCDHIIATAQCIKDELMAKDMADKEKISVVGEWAADRFFDVTDKARHREDVRREFEIPDATPMVCVVGMLRGDKAQEVLIETTAEMRRRGRPIVALIVGSVTNSANDYDQQLRDLAAALGVSGDVRFTGYRDDIPRLTQAADALAITSIAVEAQSRTVPQAFASRTPVVASDVGGIGELVTPGETGWLVPIGDTCAYADSIIEILDRPDWAQSVIDRARQFARNNLTFDAKMAKTIEIYGASINFYISKNRS